MNIIRKPEQIQAEIDRLEKEWDRLDNLNYGQEAKARINQRINTALEELNLSKEHYHGAGE